MWRILAVAAILALPAPIHAQSVNIDFGPAGSAPSATCAGVGLAGTWNSIGVLPHFVRAPLVGLKGQPIAARFARDVAADGRRFVVFHVGFAQQEHKPNRDSLAAADPNFDENKSARWLLSVGERNGFPVVPLSPVFRAASIAVGGRPLWFGNHGLYGHWNAEGHGITAEAMARYFARTLPGLDTTGTTPAAGAGGAERGTPPGSRSTRYQAAETSRARSGAC